MRLIIALVELKIFLKKKSNFNGVAARSRSNPTYVLLLSDCPWLCGLYTFDEKIPIPQSTKHREREREGGRER